MSRESGHNWLCCYSRSSLSLSQLHEPRWQDAPVARTASNELRLSFSLMEVEKRDEYYFFSLGTSGDFNFCAPSSAPSTGPVITVYLCLCVNVCANDFKRLPSTREGKCIYTLWDSRCDKDVNVTSWLRKVNLLPHKVHIVIDNWGKLIMHFTFRVAKERWHRSAISCTPVQEIIQVSSERH